MRRATTTLALLTCAAALSALGACSKRNANDTTSAAGATTAATTTPPAGASTSASAAPGEVAPTPDVSSWSDTNIVANLAAGDKAEVQMGRLADSRATIPAVRDFAKMLVTDHGKGETEVRAVASKAKLAARPAANDSSAKAADDMLKKLRSMPKGDAWDSTFVKFEYDEHQRDISAAKAMQNQARDPQLKQLLSNELPVLQKHEDAANKLLGNAPGSTAAWKNEEFRKTASQRSRTPSKTKY